MGALQVYLTPKLAQDAQIDLTSLVQGVKAKGWPEQKPKLQIALDAAVAGKLADGADLADLGDMLSSLDRSILAMDEDDKGEGKKPAEDEDEDDEDAKAKKKAEDEDEDEPVSKAAMDAALKTAREEAETATVARMNAIREAERAVAPFVGQLAVAMDSAEAVYRFALDHLGVDVKGVHPSALPAVLKAQPVPGAAPARVAMDANAAASVVKRFPAAGRLKTI